MLAENAKNGKNLLASLNKLVVPLIIILVGVGAFGLGRLSALQENGGGLVIHPTSEEGQ